MLKTKINYNSEDDHHEAIVEAATFVALQPCCCSLEVVVYDNGDLYLGERYNGEYMRYNDEDGEHLIDTWQCVASDEPGYEEADYEVVRDCIIGAISDSIDDYVADHNAQLDALPYYGVADGKVVCAASTQDEIDYYMADNYYNDYEVVSR